MLVLSRRVGERLVIGDNISVVVNKLAGNRVSLGIEAPDNVHIVRGELRTVVQSFNDASGDSQSLTTLTVSDLPACPITQRAR